MDTRLALAIFCMWMIMGTILALGAAIGRYVDKRSGLKATGKARLVGVFKEFLWNEFYLVFLAAVICSIIIPLIMPHIYSYTHGR